MPQIAFLPLEPSYREVFAQSCLIVTDYSSAVFDFVYLKKPIVYCQFDKERFDQEHTNKKGYFDYEKDGFGEVAYDLEQTVELITDYLKSGCVMKDKYQQRADSFFAFHDKENCKRVQNQILKLMNQE